VKAADRRAIEFARGILREIEAGNDSSARDRADLRVAADGLDEVLAPKRPARTKRPPAKRTKPRRSERVRDPAYLERVRELPCVCAPPSSMGFDVLRAARDRVLYVWGPCAGPVEAHHAGDRPLGRKCGDRDTAPMCHGHHADWTAHAGPFRNETKATRREWSRTWIARTQAALGIAATYEATP
jgi:hypothetical protein